jgi:beta-lactamase regulating signal transducer with metallopeptidase domain/protocatechuate 3,4-dioxygenase beta subunit
MNLIAKLSAVWPDVAVASLQGTVLIGVVVALQGLLKRRLGANWTFALWFVVLVRLSLPSLPVSPWSWQSVAAAISERMFSPPAATAESGRPATTTLGIQDSKAVHPEPAAVPAPVPLEPATGAFDATPSQLPFQYPALRPEGTGIAWLGIVWFIVALGLVFQQTVILYLFRRRLNGWPVLDAGPIWSLAETCRAQMGVRSRVQLRVVPELSGPCLFGVFRRVILLPMSMVESMNQSEWRNILLHEFAHVKRWDPLTNLWMSLVRCVHWFNPLVWWAIRRMREDRELACDAAVLARVEDSMRQAYGATLLKLSIEPGIWRPSSVGVGILENGALLKKRLQALKNRPVLGLSATLGTALLLLLSVSALTRSADDAGRAWIKPVDLSRHTDYPRSEVQSGTLLHHSDDAGMWSQIPKGAQSFLGVPFNVAGLIRLAGSSPQRDERYFRPQVQGISVGRTFDRLYLLHATYYSATPGAVIAHAKINYDNGTFAEIPIRYGDHTLNYWRQRYDSVMRLSSDDARVVWTGDGASLAEYGNSLRLCLATFMNPQPQERVRSIDLVSTWESPSEVVVGMAVGGKALPTEWMEHRPVTEPDVAWAGRLRFRAMDGVTGKPIPNMELRLEVAETGVHSRIATQFTDADGWAELAYPHRDLKYIAICADHSGHVPRFIQWTRRQHGPYPAEYIYRAEPARRITGRVVDEAGLSVAGAMVRIQGPTPKFAGEAKEFQMFTHSYAITDAAGNWQCTEVPPSMAASQISLRILHPEIPTPAERKLTEAEVSGATIESQLLGGVIVRGTVTDEAGHPIVGAQVLSLARQHYVERILRTTTDAAGKFSQRIPQSNPFRQNLMIHAKGFAPEMLDLTSLDDARKTQAIVLHRGSTIAIQVVDTNGLAIADALIEGDAPNGLELDSPVVSDEKGRAEWRYVPQTGMMLRVSRTGYGFQQYWVKGGLKNLTVSLVPERTFMGVVTDAKSGRNIPFFQIYAAELDPKKLASEKKMQPVGVGRDGVLRVTATDSGGAPLYYRVEALGYAPSELYSRQRLEESVPLAIQLKPL